MIPNILSLRSIRFASAVTALLLILLITGCLALPHRGYKSGSVVGFLFPRAAEPRIQQPLLPSLSLPLRVGVAFVPEASGARFGAFSEMKKQILLKRVADRFSALPFIQSIEVIPDAYLRPGGGFQNLEQLRSLLEVEVIVLVSYDQVQFTEQNIYSLAYWTIVGAYVFKGNRNDTHTLMEATVYDIASHALLFHAPGVDQTKASTAGVFVDGQLRRDSGASLDKATDNLIENLDTALVHFRQTVKDGRSQVQIANKPGFTGGGAFDGFAIGSMAFALVLACVFPLGKNDKR